jgi:hypothetical protein
MTKTWSKSPLRHVQCSLVNVMTLHTLRKLCLCKSCSIIIRLQLHNCQILHFGILIIPIFFVDVIRCFLGSRLCQFINPHLLPSRSLHILLHCVRDCAHHPVRFVIFVKLALLGLRIILIFPILPIVRTYLITQTVSDHNYYLLTHYIRLSVGRCRVCGFS